MINNDIISKFRSYINKNTDFLLAYSRHKNKNIWLSICSSMDWIDVSIEFLEKFNPMTENSNKSSIQIAHYILTVDMLSESVKNLHNIIFDDGKIPFAEETTIFKGYFKNKHNKDGDDNFAFKRIRAMFSTHQTDINDDKIKKYTSWSFTGHPSYDVAINLYSSKIDDKDILIGFNYEDINKFILSRYNYLNTLIDQIEQLKNTYYDKKRQNSIESTDNKLEQLDILKRELKSREDCDYYEYELNKLIRLYEANIHVVNNRKLIDSYISKLPILINEIFDNIQNMNFVELKNSGITTLNCYKYKPYTTEILSYLLECGILNIDKYNLFEIYIERLKEIIPHNVIINDDINIQEVYLLLHALYC